MSILQTIDLKKYYGAEPNITRALDGINFSVEQGEFVAVVGTSGSGKSTLLHMMGGLDTPTSGSVTVRGEELAKKLQGGLPAIALTNHTALSSAFANDVDGMLSYAQQVNGYGKAGDVFLGISTSGNSENVMYAAVTAKAKGLKVIGLTGKTGGKLAKLADVAIIVPEQETYKIQELHLPIYHVLCLMLEDKFYAE